MLKSYYQKLNNLFRTKPKISRIVETHRTKIRKSETHQNNRIEPFFHLDTKFLILEQLPSNSIEPKAEKSPQNPN